MTVRVRDRDERHLFVEHEKSRLGPAVEPFGVDLVSSENAGLMLVGVPDATEEIATAARAQDLIVRMLEEGAADRPALLHCCQQAGIAKRTAERALASLRESGQVQTAQDGHRRVYGLANGGLLAQ